MTWEHPIKRTVSKALHTYIRTYSLFKSGHPSISIKLKLYKAFIRSVTIYDCPTWEYAVDTHLLKLQCPQNRVPYAIENLDRCMPVHESHVALKNPYMYSYIIKLCRIQVEVILNHVNPNVSGTVQEAMHMKHKRLKLGGSRAYDCSAD
jgi:hypothetical protein